MHVALSPMSIALSPIGLTDVHELLTKRSKLTFLPFG